MEIAETFWCSYANYIPLPYKLQSLHCFCAVCFLKRFHWSFLNEADTENERGMLWMEISSGCSMLILLWFCLSKLVHFIGRNQNWFNWEISQFQTGILETSCAPSVVWLDWAISQGVCVGTTMFLSCCSASWDAGEGVALPEKSLREVPWQTQGLWVMVHVL